MSRNYHLAGLLTLFLGFSACTDGNPVEPTTSPDDLNPAALSLNAAMATPDVDLPPRHLVLVKNAKPGRFESAVEALGGEVFFFHQPTGIAGVEGLDEAGAEALAEVRGVAQIEPDRMVPMDRPGSSGAPRLASVVASPSDPTQAVIYPSQWNMRAIHADQAWAAGRTGSSGVTVAILDTGIGYIHPDLAGLVDLSRSVSFVPLDDLFVDFFFPGFHPIADIGFHGTHVAATVASNGLAAAGVTSGVTLMGVKVCSGLDGTCGGLATILGILHAADNGADVANMSFGGGFMKNMTAGYVSLLNRIFNYAKQKNLTIVVAAGNESLNLDKRSAPSFFSTYCDAVHVICVSATAPETSDDVYDGPWYNMDAPADYTNFGRSAITVAAPGGNDNGFVEAACSPFSLVIPPCQTGVYVVGMWGTSMAAPHVAGLAALAVEDVGKNVGRVKQYITNSADPIGGGNSPFHGRGRINVARAVGAM